MDLVKSAWFTKILRLVCDCDEINMIVMVVIKLFQVIIIIFNRRIEVLHGSHVGWREQ